MQENRLAQTATLEQQQEITRYMRSLNDWLERDVSSRQEEIRAVAARVDQLRDLLMQLLAREGPREGNFHKFMFTRRYSFESTQAGHPKPLGLLLFRRRLVCRLDRQLSTHLRCPCLNRSRLVRRRSLLSL